MDYKELAANGGICPYVAVELREVVEYWQDIDRVKTAFIKVVKRGYCTFDGGGSRYKPCNANAPCPLAGVGVKRPKLEVIVSTRYGPGSIQLRYSLGVTGSPLFFSSHYVDDSETLEWFKKTAETLGLELEGVEDGQKRKG